MLPSLKPIASRLSLMDTPDHRKLHSKDLKTLMRHKHFIKNMRSVRLSGKQATRLFLYVAALRSR